MVRQRKGALNDKSIGKNGTSSNSSISPNKREPKSSPLKHWKLFLGSILMLITIYFAYLGYLETRVNTPFSSKKLVLKSGLDVPDRFWGTYRPGVYFSLKTRDPHSLVTGLMWYFPRKLRPGGEGIRHWCEQSDNLDKYGWINHDGTNFGVQEIHDGPFLLTTSFVKQVGGSHGGDWTARIEVHAKKEYQTLNGEEVSLIWYIALDEDMKGHIAPSNTGTKLTGMRGETPGLGEFSIKLKNHSGTVVTESYVSTVSNGLHLLKEQILQSLRLMQKNPKSPGHIVLGGDLLHDNKKNPNLVATQVTGIVPFTLDVIFESGSFGTRQGSLMEESYTESLTWHQTRFNQRFEQTFHLKQKGFDDEHIKFAQALLSNMIGGIGYFYGQSKVQSSFTNEPVNYWKAPLYTAVPSRSFFPRGFLWDEGFHGLLISDWDIDIELDIMSHWFDLMNDEGWIPREQILGEEALAKVPAEFVVQKNTNANPPTFFITLNYILQHHRKQITKDRLDVLERMFPRLHSWFLWFNTTQKGIFSGSYRWRGREINDRELNPKTLASGLDDYPRASHPTDIERHIDLYCWIALAADTMSTLADVIGEDGFKYRNTANYLKDNKLLNSLHWSSYANVYADYGLHTDAVILKRPNVVPRSQNQNLEMVRVTLKTPEVRFVDTNFGYVSLFPFLTLILEPSSPNLGKLLEKIHNPNLIWTPFGLRSLSADSPLYMKRNTEHDPPYWRGQIWININYLAVKALHYYSKEEGPYQNVSLSVYKELRRNLIGNIFRQYKKSGYVWEHYNDLTGEGGGCRPFTGWTALIVSIMGENY